ncbi:MAG: glycosyltransferase [Planktothrix agardhii LY1]|jgi:glycosyltransferase involved in cell wall biosynthesis|uniref:glycosyltransferase n=1 Tax=Planktothrix agardhii TaxID=1160 RepID=UPI00242D948B|nr:glycosyltransferase [Planktothrix agardhii]MCP9296738.1 glycosyltransferase [Planktothrix agardhii LY1]
MITLSYVITTRNKLHVLQLVMDRLLPNVKPDEEVIVIDGASTDGTAEFLEELHKSGKINQFISEPDEGEAHGYNKGMLMAKGEIIKLLTDDDPYFYPNIQLCKEFMLAYPEIDFLASNGGICNTYNDNYINPNDHPEAEKWLKDHQSLLITGLGFMWRRSSLALTGLLQPGWVRVDAEYLRRVLAMELANVAFYTGFSWVRVINNQSNSKNYYDRVMQEGEWLGAFYLGLNTNDFKGYQSWKKEKEPNGKIEISDNSLYQYRKGFELSESWLDSQNNQIKGKFAYQGRWIEWDAERRNDWKLLYFIYKKIKDNPLLPEHHYLLGEVEVLVREGQRDKAIVTLRHAAELFEHRNNIEIAISVYSKLAEIQPENAELSLHLGLMLCSQDRLAEALDCYQRCLETAPNNLESYLELGLALAKGRFIAEVVNVHKRVFQPWSDSVVRYCYELGLRLSENGLIDEAVACLRSGEKPLKLEDIYEQIWQGLNQLKPFDEYNPDYQISFELESVNNYFHTTSTYHVTKISLEGNADHPEMIEECGLSMDYLKLMLKDDIFLEEIYINSLQEDKVTLTRKVLKKPFPAGSVYSGLIDTQFQQTLVETGYIYSIDPMSGKVLKSDQSFPIWYGGFCLIFYRFQGAEIFYIICGGYLGCKLGLYFPSRDLVVAFTLWGTGFENVNNIIHCINDFKILATSCWKNFVTYIKSPKQKAVSLGYVANLGHYVRHDLTALFYLYENQLLEKVDKYLIASYDFFNVAEIFPEQVKKEKIIRLQNPIHAFETVVQGNYFVILTMFDYFIKDELANKICAASIRRSSSAVVSSVEQAKMKHFPLLWVQVRIHPRRVWISQEEGIANIVKKLQEDYPNIGVVFTGNWYLTETDESNYRIANELQNERDFVSKIISMLPDTVKTYSLIGLPNYEMLVWANAIDAFITPAGTGGSVFISWLVKKPGVQHISTVAYPMIETFDQQYANVIPPVLVPKEYIKDVDDTALYTRNYDVDWQVIYNEVLKVIQKLPVRELGCNS